MSSTPRLQGKVALVTGSTQGIGKAIARLFVAEGARVILNGLAGDAALAAELIAELGEDNAMFVPADISDEAAVQAMAAQGATRFGTIDVLINNAGMDVFAEPLAMTSAQWRRCLAVDLEGALHCARAVLPGMLARRDGRIVNVASTAALKGYAYVAAYCAAKHGVLGLTRALALEVAAKGVTVNAVCPGYTETDIVAGAIANIVAKTGRTASQARAELAKANPQGRLIQPEEVADTVAWLVRSGGVNGQAIAVDGGETM